eukprot:TRINITY_DN7231_c0_g5_i1.p1 TRINITY_DN7231_c0_g5~~TRINITY_DN7231_c0_g5_i1.p1  ORF type:complete len:446 (+),score=159.91 TRINITY_DN7231_c0_g5_i1:88-1425(+)
MAGDDLLEKAAEFKRRREEQKAAVTRVHAVAKAGGGGGGRPTPPPAAAVGQKPAAPVTPPPPATRSGAGAYQRVNYNLDDNFEDAVDVVVDWIKALRIQPAAPDATATLEQVEAATKVTLNPLPDRPPRHPISRESLLDRLQAHSHIQTTAYRPAGSERMTYRFVYRFLYDIRTLPELLALMRAPHGITDGAVGAGGVAVEYAELVGVYPGVEKDVAAAVADGTLVAIDRKRPALTKGVKRDGTPPPPAAAAGGGGKVEEEEEDYSVDAINTARREGLAKMILSGSAANVVLFKRYEETAREVAALLDRMSGMPANVRVLWDRLNIERSAMPTVVLRQEQAQAFPSFRRFDAPSADAGDDAKARKLRRLKAELNSHMKLPDEAGLTYDFGKPFSAADAASRRVKLEAYNAKQEARRRRQKRGEEQSPTGAASDSGGSGSESQSPS